MGDEGQVGKFRKPRALDRHLFIGWAADSDLVKSFQAGKMNLASYENSGEIPGDEPAPDFVRVNGERIDDGAIGLLLEERGWKPTFLRVVGRWNSPYQTFANVRSPWVIPGLIGLVPLVLGFLFFVLFRMRA